MNTSVSVIIPVYNRLESLKRVVESILSQSVPVREVIVVDDGSTDQTPQALPAYIAANPAWRERVRYFYQENQGQSVAFNNGIEKATGEWLAIANDDDPWLPQKLEWQFRALGRFHPRCEVCFTDAWFINHPLMKQTVFQNAGKEHPEMIGFISDPLSYILEKFNERGIHSVWVQTLVVRATLARRIEGFDPKLRYAEDEDFVFRLACKTSFCYVSIPLVLIDRAPERHVGASKDFDKELFCLQMNQYRFEKRIQMGDQLPAIARSSARQRLKAVHSMRANFYLGEGEYDKARTELSIAAHYAPAPGLLGKWFLTMIAPKAARRVVRSRDQNQAQ